ncbi:MAG: DUF1559 domain-containing protein [Planctomycetia bacterium]|nr:DUF1559 domain-containing protein [Planctomycetia bacterium]
MPGSPSHLDVREALHGRRGRRRAFTLVELMVVIGIIGTLVALLMPAVQMARESSRRAACSNNLKQFVVAAESHKTALGYFPTGGWSAGWIGHPDRGSDWRQTGGWGYAILPYLGEVNLYNLSSTDQNTFVQTAVPIFTCPSRRGSALIAVASGVTMPTGTSALTATAWVHSDYAGNRGSFATSPASPGVSDVSNRTTTFGAYGYPSGLPATYPATATEFANLQSGMQMVSGTDVGLNQWQVVMNTGVSVPTGGVIFAGSSVQPAAIRDGFANTYLFGEKYVPMGQYLSGAAPGDQQCAYVGDSSDVLRGGHRPPASDSTAWADELEGVFGGPHPAVFIAAMCDGSVRQLSFDIDTAVHFLMAARADRQVFQLPD